MLVALHQPGAADIKIFNGGIVGIVCLCGSGL
jgi:hypothetical protein